MASLVIAEKESSVESEEGGKHLRVLGVENEAEEELSVVGK